MRHHPWEPIWLYRGLLLSKEPTQNHTAVEECSDRAFRAATAHSRLTFQLIGALIASCASCVCPDAGFEVRGLELLQKTHTSMPHALQIRQVLESILAAPHKDRVSDALRALPFNYH